MADLDVAMDHPLEPAVLDRAMSRKAETKAHAGAAAPPAPPPKAASAPKAPTTSTSKAAPAKRPSKSARRVAAATTVLEKTIGYRFSDPEMLERALTHISALKGAGRASSYQRLEFLGDHVLGLA